jgi:anti-sigma B factor antagonist
MGLHLTGGPINRINVVELHGDVDLATAPALKRRLRNAIDEGWRLVLVDLTHVTFIDSSGLAALVFAYRRLQSSAGRIAVVAPSDDQRHIFAIAGLDKILGVQASKAEAVARVTALG